MLTDNDPVDPPILTVAKLEKSAVVPLVTDTTVATMYLAPAAATALNKFSTTQLNNSLLTELTNKQKLIIAVLPGTYNLEVRKGSNVLDNVLRKTPGGQKLSWLIPHNKDAKEKADIVINF